MIGNNFAETQLGFILWFWLQPVRFDLPCFNFHAAPSVKRLLDQVFFLSLFLTSVMVITKI